MTSPTLRPVHTPHTHSRHCSNGVSSSRKPPLLNQVELNFSCLNGSPYLLYAVHSLVSLLSFPWSCLVLSSRKGPDCTHDWAPAPAPCKQMSFQHWLICLMNPIFQESKLTRSGFLRIKGALSHKSCPHPLPHSPTRLCLCISNNNSTIATALLCTKLWIKDFFFSYSDSIIPTVLLTQNFYLQTYWRDCITYPRLYS